MDFVLIDKRSTFIDKDSKIGKNVIIYENNRIEGCSVIEDNVTIFPNCFITNSIIDKGSKIYTSVIENSKLGKCVFVEPYSYIKGSIIGDKCKVKAFSRIKNKKLDVWRGLYKKRRGNPSFFIEIAKIKWYHTYILFPNGDRDYDWY